MDSAQAEKIYDSGKATVISRLAELSTEIEALKLIVTVFNYNRSCYHRLAETEQKIKQLCVLSDLCG